MFMEKKAEFVKLFQKFVELYFFTPQGEKDIRVYNQQRQQRKANFEKIIQESESKKDVTEAVMLQLLRSPKKNNNVPPSKAGIDLFRGTNTQTTIKELDEERKPKDIRQKLAKLTLDFINCCYQNPNQLLAACDKFSDRFSFRHGNTEKLTLILNALRPKNFLYINKKSLKVINYFADKSYSLKLTDYPGINTTGHDLIKELDIAANHRIPVLFHDALFPVFCEWLHTVENYNFADKTFSQPELFSQDSGDRKDRIMQQNYSLNECQKDTGFEEETLKFWLQALERTKQIIFYGPPGTGKTYIAKKLAKHLIGGGNGFMDILQFHPAYAYEDFVQGIRPKRNGRKLDYPLVDGKFLDFCNKARELQNTCVLIIDEINRANIARVFGELMYLLEYRNEEISLAYGGEPFSIPDNVRIIGTMNTADRSIALVDHALRRRFAFIHLKPNYKILSDYHTSTGFPAKGLIKILKQLNEEEIANPHYAIGISFFMRGDITEQIESIWKLEIEPYLEEYFFDQQSKVNQFRWKEIEKHLFPGEEIEKQVFS